MGDEWIEGHWSRAVFIGCQQVGLSGIICKYACYVRIYRIGLAPSGSSKSREANERESGMLPYILTPLRYRVSAGNWEGKKERGEEVGGDV